MSRLTLMRLVGILFVGLIIAGSIAGIIIPRGIGLDFANFYDAGQKALAGQTEDLYNPFALIDGKQPLGNMTFFSLPVTSYLFLPFAQFEPATALVLFKVQSTLFIWISLLVLYFHLRWFAGSESEQQVRFFAVFSSAALLFQPFWTVYRVGGQTTPLVFFLLIVGLISFTGRRFWVAAACYVLVVLVKPVFAPGLLLLFLFSENRFRTASLFLSAIAATGSILWLGWDVHISFLENIAEEGLKFNTPYYNSSMFTWVEVLLLSNEDFTSLATLPSGIKLLTLGLRVVTILSLVFMLNRLRRSDAADSAKLHFTFVVSMLVPVIFSPVVWAHYLVIFFVPLMYMIAFSRRFPVLAILALNVAVASAVFQNLLLVIKIDNRFGLDTWGEVFLMTGVKSVTMLFIVGVMLIWFRRYLETYRDPRWTNGGMPFHIGH